MGLTVDIHIVALIVHCIRIELEFGKCWFLRRGENQSTRRKTSQSREENQQQTQPTYDAETGNRTRATLVGGECSHHCVRHEFAGCRLLLTTVFVNQVCALYII